MLVLNTLGAILIALLAPSATGTGDHDPSHPQQERAVRLSLEPNHDILARDAAVTYLAPDGTVRHVEPIDRWDHRIFRGSAFVRPPGPASPEPEWVNAGWARIHVHEDGEHPVFEGAFRIHGDHHHVQTGAHYAATMVAGDPDLPRPPHGNGEYMVIWRDSDMTSEGGGGMDDLRKRDLPGAKVGRCGSDELDYNREEGNIFYRSMDEAVAEPKTDTSQWSVSPKMLFGRQSSIDDTTAGTGSIVNLASTIGSTSGCPTTRKIALMGVAADCNYYAAFGSNKTALKLNVLQQVNSASQLFESTFNIALGIRNLTVMDEACPGTPSLHTPWNVACSVADTLEDRLYHFSAWRAEIHDSNAFWTLLTTCNTGSEVGLAWLGQVCMTGAITQDGKSVSSANVIVRAPNEWQIMAHEIGHLFGAVHDCTAESCGDGTATMQQCCPLSATTCDAGGRYLMNPATGNDLMAFSPCSVGGICSFLAQNAARVGCLSNNQDVVTIAGNECGNGIVESGEECDCGGVAGCGSNRCCDPATCRFTAGSVCDPSNEDCCTPACRFAANGTVCRPSTGSCGPTETCDGQWGMCPGARSAPNGQACGAPGAGLACASGQCTSRDQQCMSLMGYLMTTTMTGSDVRSCDERGCLIRCTSPELPRGMCYVMQKHFLDGTPCGGGGKCANGVCEGASLGSRIHEWILENTTICALVVFVVGILALALLVCCARWCVRRCHIRRRGRERIMMNGGGGGGVRADGFLRGAASSPPMQ